MKIEARFDHAIVPVGAPTVVHVLLTLSAPKAITAATRPNLNIAAVIDRSGSMSGEPLEYAKQSVRLLLDQLGPNDRFSLVAYDNEVLPLVEGVRGGDLTKIKSIVDQIQCGGSTNLSGGWLKGIELVSNGTSKDEVRAVLLLTDGQANMGITDPDQLVSLGKDVNDKQAIRTTCMGLGQGFNEDLLNGIATAAGGRFYYIQSAEHAPAVFKEELGGLLETVAQNVEIELTVADGITGVAQLTGYAWKTNGSTSKLIIGDFSSEQVKHALLAFELPALTDLADMVIATMRMSYAKVGKDSIQIQTIKQNLVVGISKDGGSTPPDPEVVLHIGIQRATEARKQAVFKIDKGDVEAATRILKLNRDELRNMASSASNPDMLREEAEELNRRAEELHERENVMESRKFMVSEGSSMGRTNYENLKSSRQRRNR